MILNSILLLSFVSVFAQLNSNNSINIVNKHLTPEEISLYNRVIGAENIPNPYKNLPLSQSIYFDYSW